MNVHHLLILLTPLLISGCSILGWKGVDPITVNKKAVERTKLNISEPTLPTPRSPKWIIVTPQNAEKVFAELKEKNLDLVIFGLTDEGYEELAINIAELRNFVASQRAIIIKYKEYYEPAVKDQNKK